VTITGMALFSGMSGSKTADVAAVGSVMVPAQRRAGNDDAESVALLAATAVMGETIPPCVNMIILGFVANLSIGGLFLAGILPAVFMGVALVVLAVLVARPSRQKSTRPAEPSSPPGSDEQGVVAAAVAVPRPRTTTEWIRLLWGAGTALMMIVLILGGILLGFATPTEISAFAVVYALLIGGIIFREMTVKSVVSFFVRSASLSGMVLFIVAAAQIVGHVLTVEQVPQHLALAMTNLAQSTGTWAFVLVSIVMLIVFGSILEGAPALVIFGPLLVPVAASLGINPLQFGIVLIIAMGIGLFSPPIGVGFYTACAVGQVPMERVARPRVCYYRSDSAASRMAPKDLDALPLDTAALVHFSGITPGLSPSCAELADDLIRRVRGTGTLLSFDVNYRPGVWPAKMAAPVLLELSREVDIVFVGLDEALALWGTRSAHDVRSLIGTNNVLVVKDGAVGATEFNDGAETFTPALKVEVVEPVGAGDAFAAGFLSALLREEPAAARLSLGHILAARALASTSDYVPQNDPEIPGSAGSGAPADFLKV